MKKMILELLRKHLENCGEEVGKDGNYLSEEVRNLLDLVSGLPSDSEVERWKKEANEYSWVKSPDMMGR